jgi:hypothetical protein
VPMWTEHQAETEGRESRTDLGRSCKMSTLYISFSELVPQSIPKAMLKRFLPLPRIPPAALARLGHNWQANQYLRVGFLSRIGDSGAGLGVIYRCSSWHEKFGPDMIYDTPTQR